MCHYVGRPWVSDLLLPDLWFTYCVSGEGTLGQGVLNVLEVSCVPVIFPCRSICSWLCPFKVCTLTGCMLLAVEEWREYMLSLGVRWACCAVWGIGVSSVLFGGLVLKLGRLLGAWSRSSSPFECQSELVGVHCHSPFVLVLPPPFVPSLVWGQGSECLQCRRPGGVQGFSSCQCCVLCKPVFWG